VERRWKVLILYSIGGFMASLDAPVVTVAFPKLQQTFPTTPPSTMAWVLDAYFIAFAALLVLAGKFADRFGRRRIFLGGMWVFALASLACAVAPSAGFLIAARAVQAAGAAFVLPAGQGLMLVEFPANKRKEAVGISAAVIGLAVAASPSLGGVITDQLGWRWLFYISLIVVLAATAYAYRLLDRDEVVDRSAPLPDFLGGIVQAVGLSLLVLAVLKRQEWGTGDVRTVATFVVGLAAVAFAVARSFRHRSPVIDIDLFRDRTFALANLSSLLFSIGFFAATISAVLFMTSVWHYSVLQAGLAFAPGSVVGAVAGGVAGRIAERHGPWTVSVGGAFLAAIGLAVIALSTTSHPDFIGTWLPGQIVYSVGVLAGLTGLVGAAVTAAPPIKFALASGTNAAIRQVGGAIGVAMAVATVSEAAPGDALGRSHEAFAIGVVALAIAGVVAWFMRTPRAVESPSPPEPAAGAATPATVRAEPAGALSADHAALESSDVGDRGR
jgi:EmrB/QacA subfamily drug resistance transporter